MELVLQLIATVAVLLGTAFSVLGVLGYIRLPDVYNRAQAATKCVTLGTCVILIGTAGLAFCAADVNWPMAVKAILCAAFILLTSPVGAHAICRGAYISGVPLWQGSVEDVFVERGRQIREEQTKEGPVQDEEAEAS